MSRYPNNYMKYNNNYIILTIKIYSNKSNKIIIITTIQIYNNNYNNNNNKTY